MTKISKEVVSAMNVALATRQSPEVIAERTIQAYLNSVWKPFDAEDESTWPELDKQVLIIMVDGEVEFDCLTTVTYDGGEVSEPFWHRNSGLTNDWVTHYCDPADLFPNKEIDNE